LIDGRFFSFPLLFAGYILFRKLIKKRKGEAFTITAIHSGFLQLLNQPDRGKKMHLLKPR
jgi:hypothetical protein